MRALRASAVVLQQAGTLHVDGQLGGTSSRLRPADLTMQWQNAAVADALRLIGGYDHGVRGLLSITLDAHTLGPTWTLGGRAEIRRLHRWDLPLRRDNPALNLQVRADWLPEIFGDRFCGCDAGDAALERAGRGGSLLGSGEHARRCRSAARVRDHFSRGLKWRIALAWIRAFRPNVSEALDFRGRIAAQSLWLGGRCVLSAARSKYRRDFLSRAAAFGRRCERGQARLNLIGTSRVFRPCESIWEARMAPSASMRAPASQWFRGGPVALSRSGQNHRAHSEN